MHPMTGKTSPAARCASLIAVVTVSLGSGCSDAQRDASPTAPVTDRSHIALLLPAVQAARTMGSGQPAEGPGFHIEQRLFADGHAVGTASLIDAQADLRLRLVFHEGSVDCANDVPLVHLLLSWHAPSAGGTRADGSIRNRGTMTLMGNTVSGAPTGTWTVTILPYIEQPSVRVVPEEIRFEAELEVVFLADPCAVR